MPYLIRSDPPVTAIDRGRYNSQAMFIAHNCQSSGKSSEFTNKSSQAFAGVISVEMTGMQGLARTPWLNLGPVETAHPCP
jgi:hypothetical protein